jgi:hypothetical protein
MSSKSALKGYAIVTVLTLLAAVLAVYAAEAVFTSETWWNELGTGDRVKAAAVQAGAKWDERSKAEIIRDLRNSGKDAFPTFAPSVYLDDNGLPYRGGRLFPFTGVSHAYAVFCQEMGPWSVYPTDEHGFNNPLGLYVPDQGSVALIGDSFVNGACVEPGDDIAGVMRRHGVRAQNFGIGGTGPLIYLAVQHEYARPVRPKTVFWLFYAVDIRDVIYEQKAPILKQYLDDPQFTQNLTERQPELDDFMRGYLDKEYDDRLAQLTTAREERSKIIMRRLIGEALHLTRVKERLRNLGGRDVVQEGRESEKLGLVEKALRRAKAEAESWGGNFVFVYLPDWYYYARDYDSYGIKIDNNFLLRQDVLKLVKSLDIPIIDIQAEIFDKSKDPLSLFNWRMYGHYTPDTYRMIGERLVQHLNRQ